MSLPQAKRDSIEEVIQDFRNVLHSSLPLRNISQFYGDEKIREATDLEKEKVLKKFTEENPNLEVDLLKEGLQNVIDELVKKNEDHKSQSEAFFKKQVNLICETFIMSSKAKLEINQEMDLKSVEEMLESGKMVAMKYFEDNWNLGNVGLYEKQQDDLKEKLIDFGKEMLENQRLHLENMETRNVFENVKAIILEMSRQIKYYVDTHGGKVPKQVLKERTQNIYDYLEGKGFVLNEKYESIWSKLIGTAKAAVTVLDNVEENMSAEDCIRFSERLDTRLHLLCSETEESVSATKNGKEGNGLGETDDTEEPYEIIQDVHDGLESVELTTAGTVEENESIPRNDERLSPTQEGLDISTKQVDKDVAVFLKQRAKRGHQRNPEVPSESFTPRRSKRLRLAIPENASVQVEEVTLLNVPYKNGDFPLLRAIRNGKDVDCIKRMLDEGANVNMKRNVTGDNAAHEVIASIIEKKVTTNDALAILKLLMDSGFSLLNDGDKDGITPLHYGMQIKDLDEELLNWFLDNGADPNATVNENENSVLLYAIGKGHGAKIIEKLLEAGANPRHVNKWGQTALHRALIFGNQEAFEVFIDKVNVNEVNMYNTTPLHHVFQHDDLDHEKCLRLLCEKGANFEIKSFSGYFPSVRWIGDDFEDDDLDIDKKMIFATLMKTKDVLPISRVVASATLGAIVRRMGKLQIYLPSSSQDAQNDFTRFIVFLIEGKGAEVPLTSEAGWKEKKWVKLAKTIQTRDNVDNLMTTSFEKVLVTLLACKAYKSFVEVCNYLDRFCMPTPVFQLVNFAGSILPVVKYVTLKCKENLQ